MGLQARMLGALVAIAATLVSVSTAAAQPTVVRVETRAFATQITGGLIPRTGVAPTAAFVNGTNTCPASSAVAALDIAAGGDWQGTFDDQGHFTLNRIKNVSAPLPTVPPAAPAGWAWQFYVDQHAVTPDQACHSDVPLGSEVLVFPACNAKTNSGSCFAYGAAFPGAGPLYMKIDNGGPYDLAPATVPGRGAPIPVKAYEELGPSINSSVSTDEGVSFSTNDAHKEGIATVNFTNPGPHDLMITENDTSGVPKVPGRMKVCVTNGADGFCGSEKVPPPPEIPYGDSPCDTNGHDGYCGTIDTSGPVTHVTNITDKQVFKKAKAPGQVKGTIAEDPAAVQYVKLRLTRVATQRVLVKTKKKKHSKKKPKKRYRTVKRCTAWDDNTALLETAKCGTKYAKWFESDLDDLKQNFKYSFALKLPPGTYTLEVQSADLDNHKDDPEPGRNVITFTVASK